MPRIFSIDSYVVYFWSNEGGELKDLRKIIRIIEANGFLIAQKWYEYFGEIQYYC